MVTEVAVEYSYSVEGKTLRGNRYAFGYNHHLRDNKAEAVADALLAANGVLVRYNPQAPGESALTHAGYSTVFFALTGLLFFVVVGGLMIVEPQWLQGHRGKWLFFAGVLIAFALVMAMQEFHAAALDSNLKLL